MRSRLTLPALLIAFYLYLLVRELGHLVSRLALGLSAQVTFAYGLIPSVDISLSTAELSRSELTMLVLSGPFATLIVGYLILSSIRWRKTLPYSILGLILGLVCYLCLVLDPIYFATVTITRLGGEPEMLTRWTGISDLSLTVAAVAILVVNLFALRLVVIPALRRHTGAETTASQDRDRL